MASLREPKFFLRLASLSLHSIIKRRHILGRGAVDWLPLLINKIFIFALLFFFVNLNQLHTFPFSFYIGMWAILLWFIPLNAFIVWFVYVKIVTKFFQHFMVMDFSLNRSVKCISIVLHIFLFLFILTMFEKNFPSSFYCPESMWGRKGKGLFNMTL